jgi:hypothetical protein
MKSNDHSRECSIASVSDHMKQGISEFCNIKCHINNEAVVHTGIDATKFLFKMYENSTFRLERKYIEYLRYLEYYLFDGENDNRLYHPNSKPVCVLGKVYPGDKDAGDALRKQHISKNKGNFISNWFRSQKHSEYTFRVSKAFYDYAVENNLENITRELYDIWSAFNFTCN